MGFGWVRSQLGVEEAESLMKGEGISPVQNGFCGYPVQSQDSDPVILVGPNQLRIFCVLFG